MGISPANVALIGFEMIATGLLVVTCYVTPTQAYLFITLNQSFMCT